MVLTIKKLNHEINQSSDQNSLTLFSTFAQLHLALIFCHHKTGVL